MLSAMWSYSFFFNDTATTEIYTLSLHDALPIFGSKELVALLPTMLGLRGAGTVLIPEVAYPTYEVGAVLAGLGVRRTDTPPDDAAGVVLVWLNSPGNPHGRVLTDDQLRAWVAWGRAHGVPVVADECYVTLGWDVTPRSILHTAIAGADHTGLLAVHSLSKQSTAEIGSASCR